MQQPEVTICLLSYNRPEYLKEALGSILTQTYKNIRIVILDNASTVDYSSVLETFKDKYHTYIKHESNIGSTGNILFAVKNFSDSPFLMLFHDDDLMHSELIERQMNILMNNLDVEWVSCGKRNFKGIPPEFESKLHGNVNVIPSRKDLAYAFIRDESFNFGGVLYRSTCIKSLDIFGLIEEFSIIFDRPMLLYAMNSGKSAILQDPLLLYREHINQDSRTGPLQSKHLIGLAHHYYREIGHDASFQMNWRFRFWCAYNLPDAYFRLSSQEDLNFLAFIKECHKSHVFNYCLLPLFPIVRTLKEIKRLVFRKQMI